jgi:hypothetical protein
MRPVFDSTRQLAAFTLLLLVLLAAPWLAGKSLLPPREQAYSAEGWKWGPYPWDHRQIFEETNDIDIAFIGSSRLNFGIDTPYVQQQLDARLGRKTVVRTIGWAGPGFDALYFFTRDLLAHRRVNTVVFYDESFGLQPNAKAAQWFRYGDDAGALTGLPLRDKSMYYFAAMLGMPRNLLEWWCPNLPEDREHRRLNDYETSFRADDPESRLGSINARENVDPVLGAYSAFVPFTPQTGATPADTYIYSSVTQSNFLIMNQPLPDWETHFARQFGRLARQQGVRLVEIRMPVIAERTVPVITEARDWSEFLQTRAATVGISPGRLFVGLSEAEVDKLYFDYVHLNLNGQKYFTRLITPALLQAYEDQNAH